jgi:hypothetical protein
MFFSNQCGNFVTFNKFKKFHKCIITGTPLCPQRNGVSPKNLKAIKNLNLAERIDLLMPGADYQIESRALFV